jgi:hypothetical protein
MKAYAAGLKKYSLKLTHPKILFWVMPFMILLLIIGTVTQKEIGLQQAEEIYFSSFFYMLGFIPLPGGLTLISILFINLLAKFLFGSVWLWAKSGTIITHFGVLILIIGGGLSYFSSYEGYIAIEEGRSEYLVADYHQRTLVIREDDKIIYQTNFENLSEGLVISQPAFSMMITKACYHCGITRRAEEDQTGWTSPGKFMQLNTMPRTPQDEKNMTGIEFLVKGAGDVPDEKYLTFDKFPKPPQIKKNKKTYQIAIERATRELPFSLTLQKFNQEFHAGTDMAKAYQSLLTVTDGDSSWPVLIEMNEPFRYRGYTFYQSSFDLSGEKPYTILAVVENKGRLFPYISTLVIALGLMLHLIIRVSGRRKDNA